MTVAIGSTSLICPHPERENYNNCSIVYKKISAKVLIGFFLE